MTYRSRAGVKRVDFGRCAERKSKALKLAIEAKAAEWERPFLDLCGCGMFGFRTWV